MRRLGDIGEPRASPLVRHNEDGRPVAESGSAAAV